jgi:hypothetical protein
VTAAQVFTKTLVRGPHVRSFRIHPVPTTGWIASEEADQRVVLRRQFTDWHRVERAVTRFMGEVAELRREGWVDL